MFQNRSNTLTILLNLYIPLRLMVPIKGKNIKKNYLLSLNPEILLRVTLKEIMGIIYLVRTQNFSKD